MTTQTLEALPTTGILTAVDRCDACGARAWVRATLVSGDLYFCAHHARRSLESLRASALEILDERHLLTEE